MSRPRAGTGVTPSTIGTDAPRMGAPRTCALGALAVPTMHAPHDSHDRKARDLG